jgi:uncharacterized protein (TIGR02594 family)
MTTQTEKPLQPAVPHIHVEPPPWMLHAQTYEKAGILEVQGEAAHPTILSFFNYTTLKGTALAKSDETAWCSAFACAVMEQTGIKSPHSAAARSWLTWGEKLLNPRLGCIVVCMRVDPKNSSAAHVGFYAGHITRQNTADNIHFALLGGNQSNRVCTKNEPYENVLGYRWPTGVQL